MKELEFEVGQLWIDKEGTVVKIVNFGGGQWPVEAEYITGKMLKDGEEDEDWTSYTWEGIYSSSREVSNLDLDYEITKDKYPEYFL